MPMEMRNGNYVFFDAADYAAILGRNYAELCSKRRIMLKAQASELPKLRQVETESGDTHMRAWR